jgi:hypothetical protein
MLKNETPKNRIVALVIANNGTINNAYIGLDDGLPWGDGTGGIMQMIECNFNN